MKRILMITALLLFSSLACTLTAHMTSSPELPTEEPFATIESTTTATIPATEMQFPSPTKTPSYQSGTVCFDGNLDSGNLRVRACPGLACKEVGLLTDGDSVSTNNEYQETDGSTWLRLLAPIEGWVNGRYICKSGTNQ
jgi:hypothetical protein